MCVCVGGGGLICTRKTARDSQTVLYGLLFLVPFMIFFSLFLSWCSPSLGSLPSKVAKFVSVAAAVLVLSVFATEFGHPQYFPRQQSTCSAYSTAFSARVLVVFSSICLAVSQPGDLGTWVQIPARENV